MKKKKRERMGINGNEGKLRNEGNEGGWMEIGRGWEEKEMKEKGNKGQEEEGGEREDGKRRR